VALVDAFDLGDLRHIHGSSMNTMALSMGNKPIRLVVSTAAFKRNFVTNIPIFSRDDLHAAQVADATMPQEYVSPHFCGDALPLHCS
jgi:hypothetical protein